MNMTEQKARNFVLDDTIKSLLTNTRSQKIMLPERDIVEVIMAAREIFLTEPSLLEVFAPVVVVGDIHGQFKDLLRYFEHCGYPPSRNYLFLGDYVDRGKNSIETLTLLLALKNKYPKYVHMLRGNHETAGVNMRYGFFDECKRRLTIRMWKNFVDCYRCLPIAALINNNIFCCHGGLSPHLHSLDEIRQITRPTDVEEKTLLCDILWSDPSPILGWSANSRGISTCFGPDMVKEFLHRFKLDLIVRGHQVVEDGYEFFGNRQLVTVFSAPNYCGEYDNAGAIMLIDKFLNISFFIFQYKKKVTINPPDKEP